MTENEMTNQAAQTMPAPVTASMCPSSDYARGWNDCLAALSQTAGVAEGFVMVPVEPTPEMVSAFRSAPLDLEDVLYQERLIAGVEPDVTNVKQVGPAIDARLFRKSYASMLAAAPAASGGEDDDDEAPKPTAMQIRYAEGYSDGVRDTERIAKERESSAASVSERARELLAAELRGIGYPSSATTLAAGADTEELNVLNAALRALEQALTQKRGLVVGTWQGNAAARGEPGGPVKWADGLTYSSIPDGTMLYTTPQPRADAVRELVKRWRTGASLCTRQDYGDGARDALNECADELESLLSAASDHQQNAAQGGGEK